MILFRVDEIGKNSHIDPDIYLKESIFDGEIRPNDRFFDNLNAILNIPDIEKIHSALRLSYERMSKCSSATGPDAVKLFMSILAFHHAIRAQLKNSNCYYLLTIAQMDKQFLNSFSKNLNDQPTPPHHFILSFHIMEITQTTLLGAYSFWTLNRNWIDLERWQSHFAKIFTKYEKMFAGLGDDGKGILSIYTEFLSLKQS